MFEFFKMKKSQWKARRLFYETAVETFILIQNLYRDAKSSDSHEEKRR
mgnify:CR=1 FL=1